MIGDRLDRIASRLVREETRTTVVAPAIADLQHEAPRGRVWRERGYIGVWRAIGGGLADELLIDCRRTFACGDVQEAVIHAGVGLWVLTEVQGMVIIQSLRIDSPGPWSATLYSLLLPALVAAGIPPVTTTAAAILAKRGSPRVIVAASVLVATVLLAATDQVVTRTNREFYEVAAIAEGEPRVNPSAGGRSLIELYRQDTWQARMDFHSKVALCASTIPFAVLGIVLARMRPWLLTGLGIVLWPAYMAVFFALPVSAFWFGTRPPTWSAWIPVLVLFAAARLTRRQMDARA